MQRNPQPQEFTEQFADRHIGPRPSEWNQIAGALGLTTLDELIDQAVPKDIRDAKPLNLPAPLGERDALLELEKIAARNRRFRSFIGLGYYGAQLPPVIQRNILENPGWYTQYTPYQAEIAQGRLEALLNFQTMVNDLSGMDISNASLLDEATAAAEAMSVAFGARKDKARHRFFASSLAFPQTLAVLRTRAEPLGIELVVGNEFECDFSDGFFGALFQYPNCNGELVDLAGVIDTAKKSGATPVVAADLLALTLFKEPGAMGAEIVVGSAQRFGVPLGFGGPHPAYIASINKYRRLLPGRIVGISKDAQGKPAYRLALQTREQHIRRERATSNICTAQVLLAIIAAMFSVYHGPRGLRAIAERIRRRTTALKEGLESLGHKVETETYFDTLVIRPNGIEPQTIHIAASQRQINLRRIDENRIGISLDEQTSMEEIKTLLSLFVSSEGSMDIQAPQEPSENAPIPDSLLRTSEYLTHPVFHRYRSETEMLRYLKRLERRDLSLTNSMIPLGSCTMKLNAAAEMLPVTWPEVSDLHPFAPEDQFDGYRQIFDELGNWLAEITGFEAVSFQPNAGAQGEYAGLLAIRAYHRKNGDFNRDICLIPTSAHGTNPASAIMAGLKVTPIRCDDEGNIDLEDLREKAAQHSDQLAALMVTYPSTHGVFEEGIKEFSKIVHEHGGMVYMDGANLNAQVGICRPGDLGADVCHINLHKTFCIPHGGGGPGMGPIAVNGKLKPFLPGHPLASESPHDKVGPIAAAPWSSASILVIPWMYIRMMGGVGLRNASEVAILNANYIARRLEERYNVLYRGANGWVAHELILDLRDFKSVTVEDVAKRLIDFGYHAPTVSWPVPGSLMIEPTESESQEEIDRFCEAMLCIRDEIDALEAGSIEPEKSPLKNAPHTAEQIADDNWPFAYSRQTAAFPAPWVAERKFWPAVSRIDNVYGDRNPICSCVDMKEFAEATVPS